MHYITDEHIKAITNLPEKITTEYETELTRLIGIFNIAENKDSYLKEFNKISDFNLKLSEIKLEINSLNNFILDNIYPYEKIQLSSKSVIEEIIVRYNNLSEFDRTKIINFEDVIKSETKIKNIETAIYISILLLIMILVLSIITVKNIKHRKKLKANKYMTESEE